MLQYQNVLEIAQQPCKLLTRAGCFMTAANASPGDQVFLSGGRPSVAFVKVLKSDDL